MVLLPGLTRLRLLRLRGTRLLILAAFVIMVLYLAHSLWSHEQHEQGLPNMPVDELRRYTELIISPLFPIPKPEKDPYIRDTWEPANYNVHVFYYLWYGNPENDQSWLHWNHRYLPHWDKEVDMRYPTGRHAPPEDIASSFYPRIGPYSSKDLSVMHYHMYEIRKARIGVIAVSWYPRGQADYEGKAPDNLIPQLLDVADQYDIKVCFHMEPFEGRNALSMLNAIQYIITTYGNHSAFYRRVRSGRKLPLFYLYDSYQVDENEWNKLFSRLSELSVRDTAWDGFFIGLATESKHPESMYRAGFDGMYTYFASNTFVYASTPSNWVKISGFCKLREMLFIPSVGPGYIDISVRPWNEINTKNRDNGTYYKRNFKMALATLPEIVTITSFNEWHEGTQIEAAIPYSHRLFNYLDYGNDSGIYMKLTRQLIETMPGFNPLVVGLA